MFGTVLSFFVAVILAFYLPTTESDLTFFSFCTITVSTLFLLLYGMSISLSLNPLQRTEQVLTPRILQLFIKDRHLKNIGTWMIFFFLTSITFAMTSFTVFKGNPKVEMGIWVFLFGVTFDLYFRFIKRLFGYLDPFTVVSMFTRKAKKSIQYEKEVDLCNWIDALSEVAIKSVGRNNPSLCNDSMDELNIIGEYFLVSATSISHHKEDKQTKKRGIKDKVSYVLFYLLQRFEMLSLRSIEKNIEPIASRSITALGKLGISASKCDISLVNFPIETLGKCALKALKSGLQEVGIKASLTLVEVARKILEPNDVYYLNLKDPFIVLNTQLEEIAKELFRQNKAIDIRVLTQPFAELQELLKQPKLTDHQDKAAISRDIERILDEFMHLQAVMKTVPPLSSLHTEDVENPSGASV